uniref:Endonuclease/exonuclease/phosphatase domain-containing protein n=1 Tax=Rhodosorus marinus TaxID=101924 RepID=A0A7S3E8I4_9RHOD|mmetsp:Transcript_17342/g.70353  ORF Transcript_17342/g.70353 Transcript_17342/m.70353 type:complete len:173 (+) Transcript_17342:110-628(+)
MKTLSYATTMTRCNPSAGGKPSITPYTRPVIHTVNGQPKESEFEKVRVVSYNVLAQCYCRSSIFHWSDRGDIRWKRRKGKITKEIEEYNADLLLLQELDNFSDYHRGALRKLGYDGYTYVQRNSVNERAPTIFQRRRVLSCYSQPSFDFAGRCTEEGWRGNFLEKRGFRGRK